MSSHRFFVNKIGDNKAQIQGEDYNHIISVLRLKQGDIINIFNFEHGEYTAVIGSIDRAGKIIGLTIQEKVRDREKKGARISAAIAVIKKENMELVLEKLTEIGVDIIIPVITKRTVVRIKEEEKKQERWEKIIYAAVKQSGRISRPVIQPVLNSVEELAERAGPGLKLLIWEKEEKNFLIDAAAGAQGEKEILFFTGPEGGFEQSEAVYLMDHGFVPVSMGDTTLRAETAAILAGGVIAQALRRGKWKI
jgi:16S rRNA (uracil1498-N3)-methyltransferase